MCRLALHLCPTNVFPAFARAAFYTIRHFSNCPTRLCNLRARPISTGVERTSPNFPVPVFNADRWHIAGHSVRSTANNKTDSRPGNRTGRVNGFHKSWPLGFTNSLQDKDTEENICGYCGVVFFLLIYSKHVETDMESLWRSKECRSSFHLLAGKVKDANLLTIEFFFYILS